MSGYEDLRTRLLGRQKQSVYIDSDKYQGYSTLDRQARDKLRSFRAALKSGYNSYAVKFNDNRVFQCLINPDKITMTEDIKEISIPYSAQNLASNSEELVLTGVDVGQSFEWLDNKTHWIIYNKRLNEKAYFRAEIRKCNYQVDVNNRKYWAYARGPIEQNATWLEDRDNYFNKLNYTLLLYIEKNEETLEYTSRFKILNINGGTWEIQSRDIVSIEGMIRLNLLEVENNKEDMRENTEFAEIESAITGPRQVYPYDQAEYSISGFAAGEWSVNSSKIKIIARTNSTVTIEVVTGKSGKFELSYKPMGEDKITLPIEIISL